MLLIALLTKYSLKSGGLRVGKLMGAGSLFYLLGVAQFDVTVGPQLEGNDIALTFVRDNRVMVILLVCFILYVCIWCVCVKMMQKGGGQAK